MLWVFLEIVCKAFKGEIYLISEAFLKGVESCCCFLRMLCWYGSRSLAPCASQWSCCLVLMVSCLRAQYDVCSYFNSPLHVFLQSSHNEVISHILLSSDSKSWVKSWTEVLTFKSNNTWFYLILIGIFFKSFDFSCIRE